MKKITIDLSEELRQLMMEEDVTEEWVEDEYPDCYQEYRKWSELLDNLTEKKVKVLIETVISPEGERMEGILEGHTYSHIIITRDRDKRTWGIDFVYKLVTLQILDEQDEEGM